MPPVGNGRKPTMSTQQRKRTDFSLRATEKLEARCDSSMRSTRRRDPPKEHAPADDSSGFQAELDNLREYIT
ncbi:unnamed protein product [Clavelina lepadiformis]|uniref:Uncharacterized protein n=1 Tax=Clavelina lepadiformis TaxID=159417 RepID=A0ABP0H040_CLALP